MATAAELFGVAAFNQQAAQDFIVLTIQLKRLFS